MADTYMSSSYSSPEWVLSLRAHFTVRRSICVYLCVFCVFSFILHSCCIIVSTVGVNLMGLKPNP